MSKFIVLSRIRVDPPIFASYKGFIVPHCVVSKRKSYVLCEFFNRPF